MLRAACLTLTLCAACAPAVAPFVEGLPVVTLACPVAEPGVPFTVEGTASPGFTTATLSVDGDARDGVTSDTFTVSEARVVTATLTAVYGASAVEASCRVVVGDVGAVVPGDPGEPPPSPEGRDLTGVFALVADERPHLSNGGLNPPEQCMTNPVLALVDLVQSGGELTMSMRYCEVNVPDVDLGFPLGMQRTEAQPSMAAGLPVVGPVTFALNGDDFAPPLDVFGRGIVSGAILDDPDVDELPSADDDGRLVGDGVQMVVNGLTLNVVYRRWLRALSGTITSANEIDGSAEGSFRVDIEVGLLTTFFDGAVPAGVSLPSTFKMMRIDGRNGARDLTGADGVLDCNDVVEARDDLLFELATLTPPDGCTVVAQD